MAVSALRGLKPTKETLHRYVQILGKVRMSLVPFRNHWWHVTGLRRAGVEVEIRAEPFDLGDSPSFPQDLEHASYDAAAVVRWWRILRSTSATPVARRRRFPVPTRSTRRGTGSLAVLPYDAPRAEEDPERALLDFYESAYQDGAELAGWDADGFATGR